MSVLRRLRRRRMALGVVSLLCLLAGGCGSPPPDAAALLRQTSAHMNAVRGFHFTLAIQGAPPAAIPVQSAEGDAHPPDLTTRVELAQNGVLLEVNVIVLGSHVYLKSFTGGWQELTPAEVAQFFDVHALFDPTRGLFSAMAKTTQVTRGGQQTLNGHPTWTVNGRLEAAQVHDLLSVARSEGSYQTTYWIEPPATLWRATLSGRLFDPTLEATITFDFSKHDQPVTITAPPLG